MPPRSTTAHDIASTVEQLSNGRSTKRRAAAKQLRKVAAQEAVEPLLTALQREIEDRRTWETQYQMIMALAACKSPLAMPLLERIVDSPLEPMVHVAAGDALIRCADDIDSAVFAALQAGSLSRVEGAIRALALMQAAPASHTIEATVQFASHPDKKQVWFWVAAAAAGWSSPTVSGFLDECIRHGDAETRRAAAAALKGRYLKLNPL